ncbi:MAG: hypothetical protein NVS9B10_08860 [Nevskia sp.]
MPIPVTAATAALCALLVIGLGLRVSSLRLRHRIALGDGGNLTLLRAIRVHANTVEYVPMFVLLSLCYELYAGASMLLVGLDAGFVIGRLAFAWGLSVASIHPARRVGAALSYLTTVLLALLLLAAVVRAF